MSLSTYNNSSMMNRRRPDSYFSKRYMLIDSPNLLIAQKRNKLEHELCRHVISRLKNENDRNILKINQEIYDVSNELFEFNHEVKKIKIEKFNRRFVRVKPISQQKNNHIDNVIEKVSQANLNEDESSNFPNVSTPILQRRTAIVERDFIESRVSPIETNKHIEATNQNIDINGEWNDKLFKKRVSLAALPHLQSTSTKIETSLKVDWDENLTKIQAEERKRVQVVLKKRRSSFGIVESVPIILPPIKNNIVITKKASKYLWAPIKVKQELPPIRKAFRV